MNMREMLEIYREENLKDSGDPSIASGNKELIFHFAAYVGLGRDVEDVSYEMLRNYMAECERLGRDTTEITITITPFLDAIGFCHAEHWNTYGNMPYHWQRSKN